MHKLMMLSAVPVLAAGMAFGQANQPATSTDENGRHTAVVDNSQPVRQPNYSWIGLLGLAGLLGLRKREHVADRSVPMSRNTEYHGDVRRAG